MKQKQALYELIQAMSKSEKRYFTLDAKKSGRGKSNYLELFRAINQMEEYDEGKLQKRFGKNLPSDKSYLYEAILRSMRDYRSAKSRTAAIKEMILDAKYLYERGLYPQVEDRLQQAEALAHELDDQLSLLEISREQLHYIWVTKPKGYGEEIRRLLEEKDHCIDNINEELRFLSLSYQIQMAKGQAQPAQELGLSPTLFEEEQLPSSAHAQRRFLQSGALYHDFLANDAAQANVYYSKMLDWWDDHPAIKEEEYARYLADFFNLLHISYNQKQYTQFEQLLHKIDQERPTNYSDQRLLFKQLSNYRLLYHINLGVTEGQDELIEQVEEGIATYKLNPVSQLIIAFNLTVYLFVLDRFEQCSYWCGRVLKEYNRKVNSENFRLATQLINLLCCYELEDIDRFESALRALQRHLKQSSYEGRFFRAVTQQGRKMASTSPKQAKKLLPSFAKGIRTLRDAGEKPPLGMDDLLLNWINARLEGASLREVLRGLAGEGVG